MALLDKALIEKEFDIRLIERGINKGTHLRSDVEKHTKSLIDESAYADVINVDELFAEVKSENTLISTLHN